jgi:hypothetical protein
VIQPVTIQSVIPRPGKRRWRRIACYLPLIALALELAWIALLFLALIFSVGDTPFVNTPDKLHFYDWLSSFPAAAGVLVGLIALCFRLPVKAVDWAFLIAGSAGCAGLVYLCMKGIW